MASTYIHSDPHLAMSRERSKKKSLSASPVATRCSSNDNKQHTAVETKAGAAVHYDPSVRIFDPGVPGRRKHQAGWLDYGRPHMSMYVKDSSEGGEGDACLPCRAVCVVLLVMCMTESAV